MPTAKTPRILIVTPEITYLPKGMGNMANCLRAKAGGMADVSASLVSALFDLGADVHVALPHYRKMFHVDIGHFIKNELVKYKEKLPSDRIHLAEDRIFYYQDSVYNDDDMVNPRIALAFQREVINNIIPSVKPDLIHCNDWMTGLIPGEARTLGIPSLFTIHNIHTHRLTLETIEDAGIDAAEFWEQLFYSRPPLNYEETRSTNPVDLQASGIFSAHFINTVSPTFLEEIVQGRHNFIPENIRSEVAHKKHHDCAAGILNSPDESYDPETDKFLHKRYSAENHRDQKRSNKKHLQKLFGLIKNPDAPVLFWPSRLDPVQKGCQLLSNILYSTVSKYWDEQLQVMIIANGSYQQVFREIVNFHQLHQRVAVCDFDEELSRIGFAASDFILMPSLFEPCGLPQMAGSIYGSLPIVHNTGGLHDTVKHMNVHESTGNGFVFDHYDPTGLSWAIDEAMNFHRLDADLKTKQISRVMIESKARFNHKVTAQAYIDIYEKMLQRPLVERDLK